MISEGSDSDAVAIEPVSDVMKHPEPRGRGGAKGFSPVQVLHKLHKQIISVLLKFTKELERNTPPPGHHNLSMTTSSKG